MISERLKSLVKYINKKDRVADIGCDHALLSIYLIKNKKCNDIISTDINANALNNAINNISKYKLNNKIKTKLGPGLEPINNENVDTLIISGMGSATIIHMFKNISKTYKIITQSNNNYYELRKYFTNNGYYIKNEDMVFENNKYYINIVFFPGKVRYNKKELLFGPLLIKNKKNNKYFSYLLEKYSTIIKKIPLSNIKERINMKIRIKYLKGIIKNIK